MATSTSSIGGLVSGLDTKTLVSQLMAVAAGPQTKLKAQLTTTNAQVTAAQSVNTKAQSMTSLAKELAAAKTYTTASAVSSSASVTASASASAASGAISFRVTATATSLSVATGVLKPVEYEVDPDGAPTTTPKKVTFSISDHDGTAVSITADSGSATDLVKAINSSTAGVAASAVTDLGGTRLVLTSTTTGSLGDFTDTLQTTDTERVLVGAQDARIEVGLNEPIALTSHSNTFKDLMPGVDVTVSKYTGGDDPVVVTTAVSTSGIASKVSGLVTAMNAVLSDIAFHTKALTPGTTASATNGGLLAGNSAMRGLASAVSTAVSGGVGGSSAVQAGLAVTRDGQVTFDQAAFTTLYAKDSAKAQEVLTTFATAVQTAGDLASSATTGSISSFITGSKSTAQTLTDRISDYDVRLAAKQERLTAQYAALETALQKLKSQSDSLTQALASLTSSNN